MTKNELSATYVCKLITAFLGSSDVLTVKGMTTQKNSNESRKFAVKLRSIQAQAMKANLRDGAVVNPEPTTRDGFPDSMQHRISIGVNSMLECMSLRILGRRQASGHLGTFCASGCL